MKRLFLSLFFSGLLAAGFAQSSTSSDDGLHALLQKGAQLHDQGDYAGAIALYDSIIGLDGSYYNAYEEKSFSLYASGQYKECVSWCKVVLKKFRSGEVANIYVHYGSALDGLGDMSGALKVYSEGIRKFPQSYMLPLNKGITEYNHEKYEEAARDLESAILINPTHASSHLYLAKSIYAKNKIGAAMAITTCLLLESPGKTRDNLRESLLKILNGGAEKKDSSHFNIFLNVADLDKKTEDNFHLTEMTLGLSAASNLSKKLGDTSEVSALKLQLGVLAVAHSDKKGFFSKVYVPMLEEWKKEDLLDAVSHVIYQTGSEDANDFWCQQHPDDIRRLQEGIAKLRVVE